VRLVVFLLLISTFARAQNVFDRGVAAFRNADYERALELLHEAEALNPSQADVHAYLGATYMQMASWSEALSSILNDPARASAIPEANRLAAAKLVTSVPENERMAEAEFRRALALDRKNMLALQSLVDLAYNGRAELPPVEKARRLAEAKELRDRLIVAFADDSLIHLAESLETLRRTSASDPTGKIYASAGELIEASWRQVMRRAIPVPSNLGLLPNPLRQTLAEKYNSIINEGLADFQRALQIDPANSSAASGISDLIRGRAVLRNTNEEYAADIAVADTWTDRELNTRDSPNAPQDRVRLSESEQKLIQKVIPNYPPAASQAHVTGSVRFAVIVGRDGRPITIQPLSGNPVLFEAAKSALKQWVWRPVLVNGKPVEIVTEVEVSFSADN
jgi:tetratricopeptide (TPR) repeat protein